VPTSLAYLRRLVYGSFTEQDFPPYSTTKYVKNYIQIVSGAEDNIEQVAQLWQRDRAKLDKFSINVQRYSQNHA